jgi:AGZA family xanthine/uracil permease-like MFS transporter
LLEPLATADVWAAGAFALEQGQIITAMLLSALLVYLIEARLRAAAACAALAALLAWFGVINAWQFTSSDTVLKLGWGAGQPWALGYGVMALILAVAAFTQRRR